MKQYDSTKVSIVVAGHIVTGFAEGSMVSGERDAEKRSAHVGVDGTVTFVKSANDLGKVTISLKHNSPSNTILTALYKADKEFPFACIDMNEVGADMGITGTRCVIENDTGFERGSGVSEVEWVLLVADYESAFMGVI